MTAGKLAETVCSNLYYASPAIVDSFHGPRGYAPTVICNDCYSRQEVMVQGAERSPSEPCGKHIGLIFAKLLVLLLNGATFFTAGE